MPATITALASNIDVIGIVKKTSPIHYKYDGHWINVKAIYRRLKKRRGRARILASVVVKLKGGLPAKLVFVRDRHKKDWLTLISTNLGLSNEDIVKITANSGILIKNSLKWLSNHSNNHPKKSFQNICQKGAIIQLFPGQPFFFLWQKHTIK